MNAFFQHLFKPTPRRLPRKVPSPSSRMESESIEDGSENATRKQLVQVLLRDILRKSGIPAGWVDCQMMVVSSRSRGSGAFLRLTIRHWDERLMRYTFALQKELLKDIVRFEPAAETWLHGISWQLEVGSTCTLTTLPDKAYWQHPPVAVKAIATVATVVDGPAVAVPAAQPAPATLPPVNISPALTASAAASAASTLAARRAARAAAMPAAGQTQASQPAGATPLSSRMQAVALAAPAPATLDYGAVDFASSRPAQETELTEDLARLFALRDEEWKLEINKHVSSVGYEQTQPGPV